MSGTPTEYIEVLGGRATALLPGVQFHMGFDHIGNVDKE